MISYSEKLKDPRWQQRRLTIFQRDNWTCQLCQDRQTTLNVHHLVYHEEPWDALDEELITYCEDCHIISEKFKKQKEKHLLIGIKKHFNESGSTMIICHSKLDNDEFVLVFRKEVNKEIRFIESIPIWFINEAYALCNTALHFDELSFL